jgi:hypothetical protein
VRTHADKQAEGSDNRVENGKEVAVSVIKFDGIKYNVEHDIDALNVFI